MAVRLLQTSSEDGLRYFDSAPESDGDAIFLLHGLGNSLDYWTLLAPLTAMQVRTVAVDIPGFGLSKPPVDGLRLATVVDLLERFAASHALEHAALAGHSMGGFVALELASRRTTTPRFVALVGGALDKAARIVSSPARAFESPRVAFNLLAQVVGGAVPMGAAGAAMIDRSPLLRVLTLWPFVAHPIRLQSGAIAAALRHNGGRAVLAAARVGRTIDLEALYRSVDAPVRLVWGEHDQLVSPSDVAVARNAMRIDAVKVIEDCGHWPMLEAPGLLAEFLMEGFER